jgi:hypothetical protein
VQKGEEKMTYNVRHTLSQTKQGGIAMLSLALLFTAGLQAQSSPVITGVKATPGVITVYGSGFGSSSNPTGVLVGGATATVTSWADTLITVAYSNTSSPGTISVVVTNSSSQSASSALTFIPPALSSASVDRDDRETITLVSINGKGNQAQVAPGATFTVAFKYSAACTTDCPLAIQLGLNTGSPQACFYARQAGSSTQTLTAPTEAGIYYILFDRNQNLCKEAWDYGTPPLSQSLGTIFVQ